MQLTILLLTWHHDTTLSLIEQYLLSINPRMTEMGMTEVGSESIYCSRARTNFRLLWNKSTLTPLISACDGAFGGGRDVAGVLRHHAGRVARRRRRPLAEPGFDLVGRKLHIQTAGGDVEHNHIAVSQG